MRTLRLSLAGAVILVLLGSLAGSVLAQEEEPELFTHVSGSVVESVQDAADMEVVTGLDDVHFVTGARLVETFEWSDPRLPATKVGIYSMTSVPTETGQRLWVNRASIRLDGPDGSWVGEGRGIVFPYGTVHGQDQLFGEGAYAGLAAHLYCNAPAGGGETVCDGYIVRGDLPSQPAPVGPEAG